MTKDLVAVGQGGIAILDENSPKHIHGLCTYDIWNCVGLLLICDRKIALMHIDAQRDVNSIREQIIAFGEIKDFKIIINSCYLTKDSDYEPLVRIREETKQLSRATKIDDNNFIVLNQGMSEAPATFLVQNINQVEFCGDKPESELRSRNIYFEEYRKIIHCIKGSFYQKKLPLDLQYDGRRFTKLPLLEKELSNDLDKAKEFGILLWLLNAEVQNRYPVLKKFTQSQLYEVGNTILEYFNYQERCKIKLGGLIKYVIPVQDLQIKEEVERLTESFGKELKVDYQELEQGEVCTVSLPSDSLKKEVREKLGIDRKKLHKLSQKEQSFLKTSMTHLTIEKYQGAGARVGDFIVTFPINDRNNNALASLLSGKWKAEVATPSATVQNRETTGVAGQNQGK